MIRVRAEVGYVLAAPVLALFVAACGSHRAPARESIKSPRATTLSLAQQARTDIEFGTIKSIAPLGGGYKLRFDLGVIVPGGPDDFSSADLHYTQSYYLPRSAKVTLFSPSEVKCTARELYLLYIGRNPRHLVQRADVGVGFKSVFGWWIKTAPGTGMPHRPAYSVVRIEEQWHP